MDIPYISMFKRIELIKLVYPEANIILVTRNIDSLIDSLYKQYAKFGYGILNKNDRLEKEFDKDFLDTKKYILLVKKLFKNVLILNYDELKTNSLLFVRKICDFIDVNTPDDINFNSVHVSLDNDKINFIRNINNSKTIPIFFKPLLRFFIRGGRY